MKRCVAIDPGRSGGIAYVDENGTACCAAMPDTEGDVLELLRTLRASGIEVAVIEEVGGYVGGGGQPGSAMFKFGRGVGFLHGCLLALGYRVETVRPQRWQKSHALGTKAASGGTGPWKLKLKALAQRLFPVTEAVTLKTADAMLILDWWQHNNGKET